MTKLSPFADGLWETSREIRFGGIRTSSRTLVVALGSGGVLVHSPGLLDDAIRDDGPLGGARFTLHLPPAGEGP